MGGGGGRTNFHVWSGNKNFEFWGTNICVKIAILSMATTKPFQRQFNCVLQDTQSGVIIIYKDMTRYYNMGELK